jgi:hypothetical protein
LLSGDTPPQPSRSEQSADTRAQVHIERRTTLPTLLDLVEAVGPELVQVVAASAGLEVGIDRILIYDVAEQQSYRRTHLVLGVGVTTEPQLDSVLERRPAALVIKADDALCGSWTRAALAHEVALLATPASTDWALLHQAMAELPLESSFQDSAALTPTQLVQDLFELANGLAAALNAPITIEDTQFRLLAYSALQRGVDEARSATILGQRVPDPYRQEARRLGVARRLLSETEPFFVTVTLPGVHPRVVVALRGRGEVLGSIWAMTDQPFTPKQQKIFADGAREVSARLLHHRLIRDLRMNGEARMLGIILAGGPPAADAARRMGLHAGAYRVLAVARRDASDGDERFLQGCASALANHFAVAGIAARAAAINSTAYAVFATEATADARAAAQQAVDRMIKSLDSSVAPSLITGLSAVARKVERLAAAREEAVDILRALRLRSPGANFAETDDVAAELSMIRLAEVRASGQSRPPAVLARISRHDDTHGTSYLETVSHYLMAFADPSAASRALAVHLNTLRYRLRRIRELFDLDLDDNEVRFALLLEIRLAQIAQSIPRETGTCASWS